MNMHTPSKLCNECIEENGFRINVFPFIQTMKKKKNIIIKYIK